VTGQEQSVPTKTEIFDNRGLTRCASQFFTQPPSNKLSAVGLVESAMSAKVTTLGAPSRLFDCRAAVLGSHAALQHLKAFAVHLLHEHLD
jgi:hypothetical protein